MKILLVDQFNGGGGGQQCLLDLVPGLIGRGWSVHAAIPAGGTLGDRLAAGGVKVHHFSPFDYRNGRKTLWDAARFGLDTPRLAVALALLSRREGVDVVYANGPRVLPAAALASNRLVFHMHSLLIGAAARALTEVSLRTRNVTVIAACRFVAGPVKSFLREEKLHLVYSGVADHGGLEHANLMPRIGMLGRISEEKGHLDFLRAARILVDKAVHCEFVICGAPLYSDGAYLSEVRDLARGLPVTFLDWVEDIGPVLRQLDVLAVPSSGIDAAPRVIMEAFSAGLPVVAYRSGGIPELIDHERNGILTSPNPEALAECLLDLVADREERRRLRECGRRTYLARFTVERFRQEVLAVLERV